MAEKLSILKRRKTALEASLKDVRKRLHFARSEEQSLMDRIDTINYQIGQCKAELTISDHAIVRYIERVMNIDINQTREEIKSKVQPLSQQLGDGKYPLINNTQAVVKDNIVVTIE